MAQDPDKDPDMALVHQVLDTMAQDPSRNTAAQQAFQLLYRVNAFILWNGFGGYVGHGNVAEVPAALDALRLIGADPYVELFTLALSLAGHPEQLKGADSAYYGCPEDLYGYMARYEREHPREFPPDGA